MTDSAVTQMVKRRRPEKMAPELHSGRRCSRAALKATIRRAQRMTDPEMMASPPSSTDWLSSSAQN